MQRCHALWQTSADILRAQGGRSRASSWNVALCRCRHTAALKAIASTVRKALTWPAQQIAENSGTDGSIGIGKLLESKDTNYGYDAQKDEFTNMVQAGIIDPTKVVRHALQDAASVAGLLITTEAMVAEKPEPKSNMPAMPPGGGMGGMDF